MPTKPSIEQRGSDVLLRIRVAPKASRNAFLGDLENGLRVSLTAPPVDGAANKALVEFLAKKLAVRKAAITLRSGHLARQKTFTIRNVTSQEIEERVLRNLDKENRKE